MNDFTTIENNLIEISQKIRQAEQRFNRPTGSVCLLAVSKTKPVEQIRAAHAAGQRAFGENYVQEALEKIVACEELAIEWHYIGPIQSNKTKDLANQFHWVHTVDREKIARRLNDQRAADLPQLNICIQVNISEENSKSGCTPEQAFDLAQHIQAFERLNLRGLMAIPAATDNPEDQHAAFAALKNLFETINQQLGLSMDTLSMGMSNDMEAAIAEGSTMVRIGTAIFGARAKKE